MNEAATWMPVDRRHFLRRTALAMATSIAQARAGMSQSAAARPAPDARGVVWDKAPCRFCGTGCHVQVGVREGRGRIDQSTRGLLAQPRLDGVVALGAGCPLGVVQF